MTVTDYPTFVPGQSLTADELNLLAAHAFERDRIVGRLIGFGVNAGFTGKLEAQKLTITAGLAIDQGGEPLLMRIPWDRTFPTSGAPANLSTVVYPFITAHPNTWSVVAVAEDDDDDDDITCGDDDCAGHAQRRTRSVRIELVAGRVKSARFAFAEEEILTATPLLMNASGTVIGNIATLKDIISRALDKIQPPLDTALRTHLNGFAIGSGDITAVKAYKAAWINRVLFATIAALRCQYLAAVPAFRDDVPTGVVLGAMERKTSGWTFHCDWRHAWEPPTGLTAALIGGSCANICGPARDYLKDALSNYGPPTPPPTPNPNPGTGPILDWCIGGHKNCVVEIVPGPEIKYEIDREWAEERRPPYNPGNVDPVPDDVILVAIDIITNPVEWVRGAMATVFGTTKTNTLGDGYLNGTPLVGLDATVAGEIATQHMEQYGGAGTTMIVPAADITKQRGSQRALAFSPSDTLVLGADGNGRVVDMAIVPAMTALRSTSALSGKVAEAGERAGESLALAKGMDGKIKGLQQEWQGTFASFEGEFDNLKGDLESIRGTALDRELLSNRVNMLDQQQQQFSRIGERVAVLEGRALAKVGDLGEKAYTVDVGNTMAEFAQSAVAALKTIDEPGNKNLKEYINAVEIKQSELELAVRAGDPAMVSGATVELLDSMRTMIGGAGVDAGAKRKLDAQFRAMKGMLE